MQTVAMQRGLGVDTRVVSPSEVKQIQPELYVGDLAGGAFEPDAGYADPSLTTTGYAKAAEALGVKILQKTEVVGVGLRGRRVTAVKTNQGEEITTPVVVNATNAWANRVNKIVGIELPIESVRSQVCLLRRPPDFQKSHVVLFNFVKLTYLN